MDETLERTAEQNSGTPLIPIENAFRLMADSAPIMIWMTGTDKLGNYFNAGWLSFTGRTLEAEMGNGWTEGVHPLDLHRCLDIYLSAFDARIPFKMEYRLLHHSGAYRWILDNGVPRYDDQGNFTGYTGSCMDINDIVELEDRKDEFINAASHELKTPLTTLGVYLHILRERCSAGEHTQLQQYLDKMDLQVHKMTRLIADLLDLSKIQAEALQIVKDPVDLFPLWQEIVESYRLIAPTHKILLHHPPGTLVIGDKDRLGQVLTNLLGNAVKYSPHNSTIEVAVEVRNGAVLTRVRDQGIGIDKGHHRRLFERFYRVTEQHRQTFPGLGIGLYICAQIIQQHQGTIWVESEPGQGSLFCFALPIYPENN